MNMDDDYELNDNFKFQLITKHYTPSSSLQCHINFNFHFEFKISEFLLNQDSTTPQFIRQNDFSQVVSTSVTVQKFLFFHKTREDLYEETCEAIEGVLSGLPLSDYDMCELLIEHAWAEAWRGHVRYNTLCCCTDLDLHFLVQVEGIHVFDPSLESETCMVPAAESSIQSLEKYEIETDNITEFSCCICLEDFSGKGCEALRMPCEHFFHGDCIDKWLRTSHYCPLCRFELPMAIGLDGFKRS